MRRPCFVFLVAAVGLVGLAPTAWAGSVTYDDRSAFDAATTAPQVEDFDTFASGATVSQLYGGLVTFGGSRDPTVFWGGWGLFGAGTFSGGGLIPDPRFRGTPLIVQFATPVYAFGADVYDDGDGSPPTNTISLTATTTMGDVLAISESNPGYGYSGFLGASSTDGIVEAVFSIDVSNGNFELDHMVIGSAPGLPVPEPTTLGLVAAGLLGGLARRRRPSPTAS